MVRLSFLLLAFTMFATTAAAQTADATTSNKATFKGAEAHKKKYQAIYQLDSNDPKIIEKSIRNINNALTDPRLQGKLQIEVIAFSGGTDAFLKGSKYEESLKALADKGVILAQCNNTLRERKIEVTQLYDFIAVVPSGNGELIIREADGWAIIKP